MCDCTRLPDSTKESACILWLLIYCNVWIYCNTKMHFLLDLNFKNYDRLKKKDGLLMIYKQAQHGAVNKVNMQICLAPRLTYCGHKNCTEWFSDRRLQQTLFWLVSQQSALVASLCMWWWKQDRGALPAWSYLTIRAHPTLLLGSMMLGGC